MAKFDLGDRTISDGRNYVRRFALWEKQFRGYKSSVVLKWRVIQAHKKNTKLLPKTQGVYAFVVKPMIANMDWCGYILYIGQTETQTFKKRFPQYYYEINKKKPRGWVKEMFKLWPKSLYYYFAETTATAAVQAEEELLTAFLPVNNERFPGKFNSIKKEIYR